MKKNFNILINIAKVQLVDKNGIVHDEVSAEKGVITFRTVDEYSSKLFVNTSIQLKPKSKGIFNINFVDSNNDVVICWNTEKQLSRRDTITIT